MLTVKQDYNAARETDFDKFVEKAPESKLIGAAAHNEVALSPAQQLGSLGGAARARGRGGVGGGGCAATLARALRWCRLPHVSECAFDV